jgi:hypothetical protein
MLEDERENLDHLAVAARRLEHTLLQSPEGGRQFDERRAVTQGSRLALNDRQIVPPVENGGRTLALTITSHLLRIVELASFGGLALTALVPACPRSGAPLAARNT